MHFNHWRLARLGRGAFLLSHMPPGNKMNSVCCFDEGRRVPRRIKRATIVSFTLIFLVAVCAGALTYTVRSSSSSSSEADKDLPVLKIGVTDNDPYVYVDTTGDYAGIDIDIAREACKRAGVKPQFVDISWNDRDRLLKTAISIVCGATIRPIIAKTIITGLSRI